MLRARVYSWLLAPMLCGCHAFSISHTRSDEDSPNPSISAHYSIFFDKDKTELTADSKEALKTATLEASRYPDETLHIVGHASTNEADPATLAMRRAMRAAGFIINNYKANPRKISVAGTADLKNSPTVELMLGERLTPASSRTKQAAKVDGILTK